MLYYSIFVIFIVTFIVETIVTGTVLMHHKVIGQRMSPILKWWAISSMASISASNILGLLWLQTNHGGTGIVDRGNIVQAIFALSTLSLFIWVLTFHKQYLTKKD